MKIKDYQCKCGHDDFFFADKGNQKGIYCSYCGKWLKWADKDEQNLSMRPTVCDIDAISSARYNNGFYDGKKAMEEKIEQIRAEIIKWIEMDGGSVDYDKGLKRALCIIDKYTKGDKA